MHAVLFTLKRAQHRALALSREFTTAFGLTPARFDMLYAIATSRGARLWQSRLRRALGVAATTVSRMVKSLELLGFVVRVRSTIDARQLDVFLTTAGAHVMRRARYAIMDTGEIDFALACAFSPKWWDDEGTGELLLIEGHLDCARRFLRDAATLHYPWYSD